MTLPIMNGLLVRFWLFKPSISSKTLVRLQEPHKGNNKQTADVQSWPHRNRVSLTYCHLTHTKPQSHTPLHSDTTLHYDLYFLIQLFTGVCSLQNQSPETESGDIRSDWPLGSTRCVDTHSSQKTRVLQRRKNNSWCFDGVRGGTLFTMKNFCFTQTGICGPPPVFLHLGSLFKLSIYFF